MNKQPIMKIDNRIWLLAIVLGLLSLVFGLFLAALVGTILKEAGVSDSIVQLVKGIVMSVIVLTDLYLIQTKILQRSWSELFGKSSSKGWIHFFVGASLPIGFAALGFMIASWQGWIQITEWHFSSELISAIILNMLFAFLLEPLPEEIGLRGFAYSTFRLRFSVFLSFLCQLALFVLFPILVTYLQSISGMEVGVQVTVDYIILLIAFGTVLQLLRIFTHSLWTCIGFHLAYLEISRFTVLQRDQRLFTYHENIQGIGETFVLFFMTIVLPALILGGMSIIRKWNKPFSQE